VVADQTFLALKRRLRCAPSLSIFGLKFDSRLKSFWVGRLGCVGYFGVLVMRTDHTEDVNSPA
jgi:hypothetical protein